MPRFIITSFLAMGLLPQGGANAQQTRTASQTPEGLYLQIATVGSGVMHVHYYFWPDGRVCRALPLGGVNPADFAAASGRTPRDCGRYSIRGDQMIFELPGEAQPVSLRLRNLEGDSFELNWHPVVRVPEFVAGKRLVGTYRGTSFGTRTRKIEFVFNADGTFRFSDDPVTSQDGEPRRTSGRYHLTRNTLVLNTAGGESRLTIYPYRDDDSALNIQGVKLSREN